ncbi:hypothetical protein [Duganella radicis]|uniref:Uncharacterized protein n=1 Tax=Duganella radicis TaxID=551988 RepID=A0A6L6PU09_9BURK|nr:hypothetical protein [Duganella radicis]MTV41735.1 hypothetical protein [Duganella radicis]
MNQPVLPDFFPDPLWRGALPYPVVDDRGLEDGFYWHRIRRLAKKA